MSNETFDVIFTSDTLADLMPADRADQFFEALYGDAAEGAYDIRLAYRGVQPDNSLLFALELHERPGKCLACNLTYGLPEVFSRHPIINLKGVVEAIDGLIGDSGSCKGWRLGTTQSVSKSLHAVPLIISLG